MPLKTVEEDDMLRTRILIYRILSSAFLQFPHQQAIDTFAEENLFINFPLHLETKDFEIGLAQLIAWSNQINQTGKEAVLTQIKRDYSTLFVGPDHLLAPPWESVYLTDEKLTFGAPTLEVRKFFARHDLEYQLKNTEPDDHFGLELEFMAELANRQLQALEKELSAKAQYLKKEQLLFLKEHLLKWSDQFTQNILKHAHTQYFQGMARITRSYLSFDREYLECALA